MSYNKLSSDAMLRKAQQKLLSAQDDFKASRYDSCIGNLYYSAFQTVTSLLLIQGILINKHTHVRGYVNKELAHKGLLNREQAKLYNKLMEYRSDADYNNEVFFERDIAEELLLGVELFNDSIKKLITKEFNKYDSNPI